MLGMTMTFWGNPSGNRSVTTVGLTSPMHTRACTRPLQALSPVLWARTLTSRSAYTMPSFWGWRKPLARLPQNVEPDRLLQDVLVKWHTSPAAFLMDAGTFVEVVFNQLLASGREGRGEVQAAEKPAEPNAPSSQLFDAPAPPESPDASTLHSTVHPTLLTALQSRLAQGPVSVYDVAVGGVRIVDYVHLLDIIPPYGKESRDFINKMLDTKLFHRFAPHGYVLHASPTIVSYSKKLRFAERCEFLVNRTHIRVTLAITCKERVYNAEGSLEPGSAEKRSTHLVTLESSYKSVRPPADDHTGIVWLLLLPFSLPTLRQVSGWRLVDVNYLLAEAGDPVSFDPNTRPALLEDNPLLLAFNRPVDAPGRE